MLLRDLKKKKRLITLTGNAHGVLFSYEYEEKASTIYKTLDETEEYKERFMRYINRCTDRTEPAEDRPYEFAHPVFFAGTASNWGSWTVPDTYDRPETVRKGKLVRRSNILKNRGLLKPAGFLIPPP